MHIVFRVVLQLNECRGLECKKEEVVKGKEGGGRAQKSDTESRYDHAKMLQKSCSAEFLSHFHDGLFRSAASCSTIRIDRPLRLIDGVVHVSLTLTLIYYLTLTLRSPH